MLRCRIAVCPSMNPSGVQLRRCAILGFAHHSNPAARVKPMYILHDCSSGLDKSDESLALSYFSLLHFELVLAQIAKQIYWSVEINESYCGLEQFADG